MDDVIQDIGPNPVRCVGDEAVAALRIILADRMHDPEVPLGDEIGKRDSIATVAYRDGDHVPEVGEGEVRRGLLITFVTVDAGEVGLLFS